jgi:hypothetical protein
MQTRKNLISFCILFLLAQTAQATLAPRMYSIMTQLTGSLVEGSTASGGPTHNNKVSFEVLYLVRGGPTFGGRYIIESRNDNESTSGQAYGPMAGYYFENGAYALVTYDVLAKLGRWTNGEGFQVSVGYLEHIGHQLHVGVQYSTRSIRYKTDITNNLAIQKDVSEQFPSLVLMYLF